MKLVAESQRHSIRLPGAHALCYPLQHGSGFQYEGGKCYSTQICARPELGDNMPEHYDRADCQLFS